jgi:hypothetical protein
MGLGAELEDECGRRFTQKWVIWPMSSVQVRAQNRGNGSYRVEVILMAYWTVEIQSPGDELFT